MFGLMKNAGCQNPSQPEWYRLHYCGLCKSIGSKYDQKSRLLMNYDAVFLAEVLSLLATEETGKWDKKIRGYQCFSLPEASDLPRSLDYASDVNMLLAQLRVKDNKADDLKMLWSTVEKVYRKPFSKIANSLKKWQVDETVLSHWLKESQSREISPLPSNIRDWQNALSYHATPTASITAYFFALGANIIGKPEDKDKLYNLGYSFGELIYSLDAVKDLPEDREGGQFNPLSQYFGADRNEKEMIASTKDYLWKLSEDIEHSIQELPLQENLQKALQGRLIINLSQLLSAQDQTCQTTRTGIEKSTLPRISRFIGSVFTQLNPAYPGKFALSYLLFLFLFFSNKLLSSVAMVVQSAPERVDWSFLSAAVSLPVLAYLVAKRRKKGRLVARLKRLKEKIKSKIAELKDETGANTVLLVVLIVLLILLIIVLALLASACNACGDSADGCCSDCCSNVDCSG